MTPKILIARIARGAWNKCEISDFLVNAYGQADLVEGLCFVTVDQEPTSSARNKAVAVAKEYGADITFQVDDDMVPSLDFFARAVKHLMRQRGPHCVGSPYCGARANGRKVQVFKKINRPPDVGHETWQELLERKKRPAADRVTRKEAVSKEGIEEVYMIGTGLIAFDMRCFDHLTKPYFRYTFTDETEENVQQTEDIYFTQRLSESGGKVWADWSCWSGHAKEEIVTAPTLKDCDE